MDLSGALNLAGTSWCKVFLLVREDRGMLAERGCCYHPRFILSNGTSSLEQVRLLNWELSMTWAALALTSHLSDYLVPRTSP